jgi:hypothetical protein
LSKEKAIKVIDRLEGTLIADLKSLKIIAEERSESASLQAKLPGAFNFLLFITGLIACETLGYFINKASEEGRSEEYIKFFVSSKHFKQSAFKKTDYLNTFASLRTNLVHVFGMTDLNMDGINTGIGLSVGGSKKPAILRESGVIKINGVKFLELVIDGFASIKSEVMAGNDSSTLVGIIGDKK